MHAQEHILFEQTLSYRFKKGGQKMNGRANLKSCLLMAMFLIAMGGGTAVGQIIYVDVEAPGVNDGSSWTDAYNYLQDGLAAAWSGDEIWVAQGIYKPDQGAGVTPGDRTATFQLINGVAIKGGYAGFGEPDPNARDIDTYESILSGDLDSNDVEVNDPCDLWNEPSRVENSYHVVTGSGTDETAVLDGFTVTAGNAFERPWHPMMPTPNNWGGGMYNEAGSPTLVNCMFRENSAERYGGGIYNKDLNGDCSPTLTNCTFSGNAARSKDGWEGSGGGMYNSGGSPVLTKCTFAGNRAEAAGGGMSNGAGSPIVLNCMFSGNSAGAGGGMSNSYGSSPIVTGCLFIGNSASGGGGGMNSGNSSPTVNNCIFIDNSAEWGGGVKNSGHSNLSLVDCTFSQNSAAKGAGIHNILSSVTLTNCMVIGNSADIGGGIYCGHRCEMTVHSCTFEGNSAQNANAVAFDSYERLHPGKYDIRNSIFWDGCGQIWNKDGSEIIISYSDVEGGESDIYDPCNGVIWGDGNIDADPCFADVNNGDYHLKSQAGRWDANEGRWTKDDVTSACIDAGNPADPIGNEPFPNGGIINMGAYGGTAEASKSYFVEPVCETIVAGDINGDCKVNFKDFAFMAYHWLEDNSPGPVR